MSRVFYLSTVQHWQDMQLSSAGVATFYPTMDGTPSGGPLFTTIYQTQVTAESNTATMTAVPMVALKSISADLTTITANVITGTVQVVVGATLVAAPDGTKVHCLILGN